MNIPDDVRAIARDLSLTGCGCDEDASHECPNMDGYCRYQETAIARAILSERESATKAERERCAQVALGCDTMGVNYPDDALMKIGRVARAKCFAIAAAIRKGDGE